MSSPLNSPLERAIGNSSEITIRDDTESQNIGLAADPAPFIAAARKNKPLWLKAHPLTLSLFGLALAVVLWGLEYKVSLYHPHPKHSDRVGVAKLWLGPRRAVIAKASRTDRHSPTAPELQFLVYRYVSASEWSLGACCREVEFVAGGGFLPRREIPRAPPSI